MSNNSQYVAAANNDHEVYLFNTTDHQGIPMWNFNFLTSYIQDLAFSADDKYLLVSTPVIVYYFNNYFSLSKQEMWSYEVDPLIFQINSADITLDSTSVLVGTGSPTTLYLFDNKGEKLWNNPLQKVESVAISAKGEYFVAGANLDPPNKIYLFHRFITSISSGGGGDDDNDEKEGVAIPFGNYHLIFTYLTIIFLIITME